jgi:hypothetical protein
MPAQDPDMNIFDLQLALIATVSKLPVISFELFMLTRRLGPCVVGAGAS